MIGSVVYWVDRRSRDIAKVNLAYCHPIRTGDEDQGKIAKKSISNFVHNMCDLVWFASHVNGSNYSAYFEIQDPAQVLELEKSGCPLVFVTFHFGNFEMTSFFMGHHGQGTLVVQQETKNPAIGKILSELRVVGRNRPVGRTGVMLRLLRTLKKGGNIGILADLTLPPEKPSVIVDFLGLKMCVTRLHVELAMRAGAPIVMMIARPMPDGRYRLEICPPFHVNKGDSVEAAVQRCIDQLAEWVRHQPELWLWGYKHFRYQDPDNPAAYPPYANPKKAFNKKLRQQQQQEQEQEQEQGRQQGEQS
jgi:lauroyl/myristoyl acyltransferase